MSLCFKCLKSIGDVYDRKLIALDRPYVNLFFHSECLSSYENIYDFLLKNAEKIYEYIEKTSKNKKKRIKRSNN